MTVNLTVNVTVNMTVNVTLNVTANLTVNVTVNVTVMNKKISFHSPWQGPDTVLLCITVDRDVTLTPTDWSYSSLLSFNYPKERYTLSVKLSDFTL